MCMRLPYSKGLQLNASAIRYVWEHSEWLNTSPAPNEHTFGHAYTGDDVDVLKIRAQPANQKRPRIDNNSAEPEQTARESVRACQFSCAVDLNKRLYECHYTGSRAWFALLMAKRLGIDDPTVHIPTTVNVSLPRQFENGDFLEWATRFELCSRSNGWTDSVMAMKLPTLLEGEAYIVYQGLPEEVLNSYVQLKEALTSRLHPDKLGHSALQRFEERKLQPGETVECFAYHLRRLLTLAIPSLDAESRVLDVCAQS
uniref:J domain-containing protein n=1 Tax=Trichuris muris TaxID=70415 RepID=A0A5S6QDX7_TRIMR